MRRALLLVVGLALAASAQAQNWSVFKSDRFGFAMLVPPGTRWEARDFGNGWGGMHTRSGVVEFVGIVRMGHYDSAAEMEQAAVKLTKIPASEWSPEDRGSNANGWKWWRTYNARVGKDRIIFAVIGTGKRGSYVLFLETTREDFTANRPLYRQWYQALTLY